MYSPCYVCLRTLDYVRVSIFVAKCMPPLLHAFINISCDKNRFLHSESIVLVVTWALKQWSLFQKKLGGTTRITAGFLTQYFKVKFESSRNTKVIEWQHFLYRCY